MLNLRQARVVAPVIHAGLFALIWLLDWVQTQPLFDGPSRYPFAIIFLADLPFSAFFFGVIFTSAQRGPYAAVAWGIVGTIWWWFLGSRIDRLSVKKGN